MKYNRIAFFSILLIVAILAAACARGQGSNAPTDGTGGASTSSPGTGTTSLLPAEAASYLYEGLVKVEGSDVAPLLAESWSVSDDGLDYIFNLRSGVSFH